MAIQIIQPVFLHEIGRRPNNEDFIFPYEDAATTHDRLFIVCDGVGGANKGEVASRMVCALMQTYFSEHPPVVVGQEYVDAALKFAEAKLSEYTAEHPECAGMATTLTLLYLNDRNNTATIAWSGDSRIYHVRSGQILFESSDHSLVNELMKRGELSEEEAKVHPQRNVILRAISGEEQPTRADVEITADLQAGDFFMLCTDGILESVENRILTTLLQSEEADLEVVRDKIREMCADNSNDNHSMYLLQIEELTDDPAPKTTQSLETAAANTSDEVIDDGSLDRKNTKLIYLLALGALSILIGLGVLKWYQLHKETEKRLHVYNLYTANANRMAANDSLAFAREKYQFLKMEYPMYAEEMNRNIAELDLRIAEQARLNAERDTAINRIYQLEEQKGVQITDSVDLLSLDLEGIQKWFVHLDTLPDLPKDESGKNDGDGKPKPK